MDFIRCIMYLASLGIAGFIIGRLLPKKCFYENVFPFKQFRFEKGGKFYERFQIRKWKDKLFDMSRMFPKIMPVKKLQSDNSNGKDFMNKLPILIKETCIAEFIHSILSLAGFVCVIIWDEPGGLIVSILYALGNVPFIMVQRYNRPRFVYLMDRRAKHSKNKQPSIKHISSPTISSDPSYNAGVCFNILTKGENTAKSDVLYHNHE